MYNCNVYIVDWGAQTNTILLSTQTGLVMSALHVRFEQNAHLVQSTYGDIMVACAWWWVVLRYGLYCVPVDLGQDDGSLIETTNERYAVLLCSPSVCSLYAVRFLLDLSGHLCFHAESNVITTVLQAPFALCSCSVLVFLVQTCASSLLHFD